MDSVRFQYELVILDVKEVRSDEEQYMPNTCKNSRKNKSVTEWCRCGTCGNA